MFLTEKWILRSVHSLWAKLCKTYFGPHIFTTMILWARIIEVKRKTGFDCCQRGNRSEVVIIEGK